MNFFPFAVIRLECTFQWIHLPVVLLKLPTNHMILLQMPKILHSLNSAIQPVVFLYRHKAQSDPSGIRSLMYRFFIDWTRQKPLRSHYSQIHLSAFSKTSLTNYK